MSLEISINELNITIKALIHSMNAFALTIDTNQVVQVNPGAGQAAIKIIEEVASEQIKPPVKVKAPKAETVTITDLQQEATSPSELRLELQTICSSKIVANRSLKEHIVATIASYGGATHLAKVPDANLLELRTKLLALK